jgi:hypothetical protein
MRRGLVSEQGACRACQGAAGGVRAAPRGRWPTGGAARRAGVNVMAGATLGGGTRINWSASFRTPDHVRREWARELGLTAFEGPRFTAALDAVCARIGVSTGAQRPACARSRSRMWPHNLGQMCLWLAPRALPSPGGALRRTRGGRQRECCAPGGAGVQRHNRNNTALKDGLEALGVHCEEIPRNCDNTGHECGYCCFGCASGGKRDASGTWLLDAVGAGARILTGARPLPAACRAPRPGPLLASVHASRGVMRMRRSPHRVGA